MKEKRNLHLKVQELCDCYATTDPLKEMSVVGKDKDPEEAALKWLALAALHGVGNNAKEITIRAEQKGRGQSFGQIPQNRAAVPGRRCRPKDHGRRPRHHPHRGRPGKNPPGVGNAQRQPGTEGQNQSAGRARESQDRVPQITGNRTNQKGGRNVNGPLLFPFTMAGAVLPACKALPAGRSC